MTLVSRIARSLALFGLIAGTQGTASSCTALGLMDLPCVDDTNCPGALQCRSGKCVAGIDDGGVPVDADGGQRGDGGSSDADAGVPSGIAAWAQTIGSPGQRTRLLDAVAAPGGGVYVLGVVPEGSESRFGSGPGSVILADPARGSSGGGDRSHAFVASFSSSGALAWVRRVLRTQDDDTVLTQREHIAVLRDGTVLVAFVMSAGADVEAEGQIVASLRAADPTDFNEHDLVLLRFDDDGALLWSAQGGAVGANFRLHRLVARGENFTLLGSYRGAPTYARTDRPGSAVGFGTEANGFDEEFMATFSPEGVLDEVGLVVRAAADILRFSGAAGTSSGELLLGLDVTGEVGFAGQTLDDGQGTSPFVVRIGADGQMRWQQGLYITSDYPDTRLQVGSGRVFVAGAFTSSTTAAPGEPGETRLETAGGVGAWLAALDEDDGEVAWVTAIGGENEEPSSFDVVTGLLPLADGELLVTGVAEGESPIGEDDLLADGPFLVTLDANGRLLERWPVFDEHEAPCVKPGVLVPSDGDAILVGTFSCSTSIGAVDGRVVTPHGDEDVFAVRLAR